VQVRGSIHSSHRRPRYVISLSHSVCSTHHGRDRRAAAGADRREVQRPVDLCADSSRVCRWPPLAAVRSGPSLPIWTSAPWSSSNTQHAV
jgi:hypothetical protein